MNQDSSFPPMLPPSTEFGALLFAVLPCLTEPYRPLASFAYHMTELSKLKKMPSVPSFSGLSGIDALIADKDSMLRSLSFYGKLFRMPLLSTIATLLQGMQFYQAYKDILPGLFSGMSGAGTDPSSSFGSMAGLFSGLGGLSPDLMSSLFSGGMGNFFTQGGSSDSHTETTAPPCTNPSSADEPEPSVAAKNDSTAASQAESQTESTPAWESTSAKEPEPSVATDTGSDDLYNTLYSFLTPEQQKIYEQLMHTD